MIIRNITIENYMCYHESNKFELSDGLNIVLGENGEGKTKLIEAIEWLMQGYNKNLDLLVSAKKLDEISIGDSLTVKVSVSVEQYNEKRYLTRSFNAKKTDDNSCTVSNLKFEGIEENNKGERSTVDASRLLEQIFPNQIRRYSLFKGEAELSIFDNDDALTNLINLFSNAKHYDKYSEIGSYLLKQAEKAVAEETKTDKKNQAEYNRLEYEIQKLEHDKTGLDITISETINEIEKVNGHIQKAAKYVSNASALEIINKRIKNLEEQERHEYSLIKEKYTTYLFDNKWILLGFEKIFKQYENKVKDIGKSKRKLQSDFDYAKGEKQGEKRAIHKLLNDQLPLAVNIPNKEVMEELIKDEWCKVCNRSAPKGSEAYEYMRKRLETYLETQNPDTKSEDEILFQHNYSDELIRMLNLNNDNLKDIKSTRGKIKELFEFNEQRKINAEKYVSKLEEEIEERNKIISSSDGGAEKLGNILKNYNQWQEDLKGLNKDKLIFDANLKIVIDNLKLTIARKDEIDTASVHSFLIKTRGIIRDIDKIFIDTKEMKFDEFIDILQTKSNIYFSKINKGAFTGNIVLSKRKLSAENIKINVELYEEDRKLYNPNQSLLTSMHISILFAISQLAEENREEGYPLIFDAPTSSFGETKTGEFLNIIADTKKQIILLIKDFIGTNEDTGTLFIKPEFNQITKDKAFWVRLERPFDSNSLKTINSEVIEL